VSEKKKINSEENVRDVNLKEVDPDELDDYVVLCIDEEARKSSGLDKLVQRNMRRLNLKYHSDKNEMAGAITPRSIAKRKAQFLRVMRAFKALENKA